MVVRGSSKISSKEFCPWSVRSRILRNRDHRLDDVLWNSSQSSQESPAIRGSHSAAFLLFR